MAEAYQVLEELGSTMHAPALRIVKILILRQVGVLERCTRLLIEQLATW
jgi:hypothetical protein